ncbi:MAG: T9SS type A sorting domain-containing protein [Bacteroidota bacterium]
MKIFFSYIPAGFLLLVVCQPSFSQGIYNSASIVVNGNAVITVQNGCFSNNGSFYPGNGTVEFTGIAATNTSAIGGSSTTPFYNLTINKADNAGRLAGNISVDGSLLMQSGNLELNLFNIDLGNGAGSIMNENIHALITGTTGGNVIKTASLNAPASVNPGNIGIAISSAANLGNTVIKRGHQQQTIPGGLMSINRYYDITPTNNNSLNASLQMYYLDNELAGINKSTLNFYRSEDNGISYSLDGADNNDQINDWVLKNNIPQLSRWTLAGSTSALPVKLISFTAQLVNRQTKLQWITTQEINSSYFDVQRSPDGTTFNKILNVPAQGNSNLQSAYNATDLNPANGIDYYRLKEVDKDGTFSFSPVVYVKLNDGATYSVFPNPASAISYLNINLPAAKRAAIGLYDVNGRMLQEKAAVQLNAGNNQVPWDISGLAKGIYFLQSSDLSMPVIKVVKL